MNRLSETSAAWTYELYVGDRLEVYKTLEECNDLAKHIKASHPKPVTVALVQIPDDPSLDMLVSVQTYTRPCKPGATDREGGGRP